MWCSVLRDISLFWSCTCNPALKPKTSAAHVRSGQKYCHGEIVPALKLGGRFVEYKYMSEGLPEALCTEISEWSCSVTPSQQLAEGSKLWGSVGLDWR